MWNGQVSKVVVAQFSAGRCSHVSGLSVRSSTAGHDEIRDADRRGRDLNRTFEEGTFLAHAATNRRNFGKNGKCE